MTYPLKITVNPKKADKLENIKLKISGTLENGVIDERINAKFAVGGTEDMDEKKVSFMQDYTIERTGNSIMIPVTIEVQGAKDERHAYAEAQSRSREYGRRGDFRCFTASIPDYRVSDECQGQHQAVSSGRLSGRGFRIILTPDISER